MRDTYIPLFTSALDSSLWSLDGNCLKVFLTLALKADYTGLVSASIDGIARSAALPVSEVIQHLKTLEGPDEYSKDLHRRPSNGGRRIERIAGGWKIINIEWYREEARKRSELARKREWARANNSGRPTGARRAARRTETETKTETKTETETDDLGVPPNPPSPEGSSTDSDVSEATLDPTDTDCEPAKAPPIAPPGQVATYPAKARKRLSTGLPDGLEPNPATRQLASRLGVDIERELSAFADYHQARDSRFVDWQAALRTWVRNAANWGGPRSGVRPRRTELDDVLQSQADRVRMLREQEAEDERRKAAGGGA